MNFAAYVERQIRIIRDRHTGETVLCQKGHEIRLSESEKLLCELDNLKGLRRQNRTQVYSIKRERVYSV